MTWWRKDQELFPAVWKEIWVVLSLEKENTFFTKRKSVVQGNDRRGGGRSLGRRLPKKQRKRRDGVPCVEKGGRGEGEP